MGSRNPDRIPLSHRRARCESVGQMIAQGWDVQAWCMTCRIQLRVDLRVVAAFRGREFSLWNQSTPCRSAHCRGVAYFFARAPGMAAHEQLQTPPTTPGEPPPPAWIARRGP